jgi:hypothetical protein
MAKACLMPRAPAQIAWSGTALASAVRLSPFIVLAVLTASMALVQPINHDVAWFLVVGERVLEGDIYGRDVADINLPSVAYLNALVVSTARALAISPYAALAIGVVLAVLAAAWIIERLGRESDMAPSSTFSYVAALSFCGAVLLLPGNDFAQREQIGMALLGPYLMACHGRARARAVGALAGVTVGVLAGAGVLIKPQLGLVLPVLETYLVWRLRTWRTVLRAEVGAAVATGAAGAAAMIAAAPAYFSKVVPLAASAYWAYDASWAPLLISPCWLLLLLMAVAVRVARPAEGSVRVFAELAALAASAFFLSWLLQGKLFEYQALPFRIAIVWQVALVVASQPWPRTATDRESLPLRVALAAGLVYVLGLTWQTVSIEWHRRANGLERLHAAVVERGPVETLFVFSTSIEPALPLAVRLGAAWSGRYGCLWPLPAAIRRGPLSQAAADTIGADLVDAVVADLRRRPADVILVETSSRQQAMAEHRVDFVAWLSRDAEFRRVWSSYTRVGTTQYLSHSFDIFMRNPAPGRT